MAEWDKVVVELVELIKANQWRTTLVKQSPRRTKATFQKSKISKISTIISPGMNGLLPWVPTEDRPGREVYNHLCKSHFILDQAPALKLQTKV